MSRGHSPLLCNFDFAGWNRSYLLHLPPHFDKTRPLPLVFMFHGAGGTAELAAEITGWRQKADAENFIVVFPNGLCKDPSRPQSFVRNPQFWHAGVASSGLTLPDDVAFVDALIDRLQEEYGIDQKRIYVTGFSNGAAMAWRLAVDMSERVAAVGPVAGFLAIPEPKPTRPVPALIIACEDDPMIPIDGGLVKDIWSKEPRHRPSLRAIVKEYAMLCGCPEKPDATVVDCAVTHFTYISLKHPGIDIHFYTIAGAGHTYPGGAETLSQRMFGKHTDKLNATDLLWDYFRAKKL